MRLVPAQKSRYWQLFLEKKSIDYQKYLAFFLSKPNYFFQFEMGYLVQSVKSRHQYLRFFKKELSISRFLSWDQSQMKALVILHTIGVFSNFQINLFLKNNGFFEILCYNDNFTENSMKWQLQHKNRYFFKKNYNNCNVLLHRVLKSQIFWKNNGLYAVVAISQNFLWNSNYSIEF